MAPKIARRAPATVTLTPAQRRHLQRLSDDLHVPVQDLVNAALKILCSAEVRDGLAYAIAERVAQRLHNAPVTKGGR